MDAFRLQTKTDLGNGRSSFTSARPAVEPERRTTLRPILTEQDVHCFVQSSFVLGRFQLLIHKVFISIVLMSGFDASFEGIGGWNRRGRRFHVRTAKYFTLTGR
jgi:hypothetical protein